MDEMTAEAILDAVSKAYKSLTEYEDAGLVSEGGVPTVRFETRFRRGTLLHFAYTAFQKDGGKHHEGKVTSEDRNFSFWCSLNGPQPSSLRLGIGALTGISWGAAHGVPSLLLPEEVGGWLPTDLVDPVRLPDVDVFGTSCFHIQGKHPRQPGAHSLFVDGASFLIRRRISHERGGPQVTDYEECRAA